jgi:hypothetical protein
MKRFRYADAIRMKHASVSQPLQLFFQGIVVTLFQAKRLSRSWSSMPSASQQGMPNLTGYLCFRISLFQCLVHQPQFVNFIQKFHPPQHCVSDDAGKCVSCLMRQMTLEYWRGARSSADLSKVLQRMVKLFTSRKFTVSLSCVESSLTCQVGWASDVISGQADPMDQALWLYSAMRNELPSP